MVIVYMRVSLAIAAQSFPRPAPGANQQSWGGARCGLMGGGSGTGAAAAADLAQARAQRRGVDGLERQREQGVYPDGERVVAAREGGAGGVGAGRDGGVDGGI